MTTPVEKLQAAYTHAVKDKGNWGADGSYKAGARAVLNIATELLKQPEEVVCCYCNKVMVLDG